MRLLWAAPVVGAVLAGIKAAQVWIPGRTAEITDPLLAIVMGAVLGAFQPKANPCGAVPVEVLP
jgi:VanZ family protein